MNRFLKLAILMLVASCGGGNYSAPRQLDNACAIVRERPAYYRAMQRTERRWGVPVAVQMASIHQESKFIGDARTPHQYALGIIPIGRQSSAYGYSQALDGTWEEYQKETGNRRASRDDIDDATDFMGWYMDGSTKRLGISKWDARALRAGPIGRRPGWSTCRTASSPAPRCITPSCAAAVEAKRGHSAAGFGRMAALASPQPGGVASRHGPAARIPDPAGAGDDAGPRGVRRRDAAFGRSHGG